MRLSAIGLMILLMVEAAQGGVARLDSPANVRLPGCGSIYAPPFAPHKSVRTCPSVSSRVYKPRYSGIAYEILASESEACFVPDEQFMLLDLIIDDIRHEAGTGFSGTSIEKLDRARRVSTLIGETLERHNFALFVFTDSLSDTLVTNGSGADAFHAFDCDTSSFIYLTIAENLGLPLSFVEITLASGSGHNYVRWQIDESTILDWDTNGRAECRTPEKLPKHQGRGLTRQEVLGYARALRAELWQRQNLHKDAVNDLRDAATWYPDSGLAHNNFAWAVATKEFDGRLELKQEAVEHGERAVALVRNANHLDTLACANAFSGRFDTATKLIKEAMSMGASLDDRLERFKKKQDCTGLE